MNTRVLLAIAGSALLAACGSDSKSPTEPNLNESSFSATVTGDVARALSGEAAFGADNTRPDIGFGMVLVDSEAEEPNEMVMFYRSTTGVPGVGALTVADAAGADDEEDVPASELVGIVILDINTQNPAWCFSSGGSFNVTSSASNRLKGNYDIALTCARIASEEIFEIDLAGTYDAVGGAVVIPDA